MTIFATGGKGALSQQAFHFGSNLKKTGAKLLS
jgi:hypothetical protein